MGFCHPRISGVQTGLGLSPLPAPVPGKGHPVSHGGCQSECECSRHVPGLAEGGRGCGAFSTLWG